MFVVRVIQQVVVQAVDTVAQQVKATGQGRDGPRGLRVTGNDSKLFANCANLPRMNKDAARVVLVVGRLGQQNGPALVVVNPFRGQLVMCKCFGHGDVPQ